MNMTNVQIHFRVLTELGEIFQIKIVSAPPSQPHFSLHFRATILIFVDDPHIHNVPAKICTTLGFISE